MKVKNCRSCDTSIPGNARVCPYCFKRQWTGTVILLFLVLLVFTILGGYIKFVDRNTRSTESVAPAVMESAKELPSFSELEELAEQERLRKEQEELIRRQREQAQRERVARERAEKERLERKRRAKERAEQERHEQERLERERAESARREKEREERERIARERAEREEAERETVETEQTGEAGIDNTLAIPAPENENVSESRESQSSEQLPGLVEGVDQNDGQNASEGQQ